MKFNTIENNLPVFGPEEEFWGSDNIPEDAINPIKSSRSKRSGKTVKRTVDYMDEKYHRVYFSTDDSRKHMKHKSFCSCCGSRYCLSGIDPQPYGIRGAGRAAKKHFQSKVVQDDLQDYFTNRSFEKQYNSLIESNTVDSEVVYWPEVEWKSFWDFVYYEEGEPEELYEEVVAIEDNVSVEATVDTTTSYNNASIDQGTQTVEDMVTYVPIFYYKAREDLEIIRHRRLNAKKKYVDTVLSRKDKLVLLSARYSAKLTGLKNMLKTFVNKSVQEIIEKSKLSHEEAFKLMETHSSMKKYYRSAYSLHMTLMLKAVLHNN